LFWGGGWGGITQVGHGETPQILWQLEGRVGGDGKEGARYLCG